MLGREYSKSIAGTLDYMMRLSFTGLLFSSL